MKLFNSKRVVALLSALVLTLGAFVLPVSAEEPWNDAILDWGVECEGEHTYDTEYGYRCTKCGAYRIVIVTAPQTTYGKEGETVQITVKAEGYGNLTYQWYIRNATGKTYTKSSVVTDTYSVALSEKSHNRRIYCIITDGVGNQVQTDTVLVRRQATITKEPSTAIYAKMGATASVKMTAVGEGLKYTWYVKDSGKTSYSKSSITKSSYSVKMASKVKGRLVYCIVKDAYGKSVQSKTVVLREAASITTQPKTGYAKKNATAKVTVKASGDSLKYTWYVKNAGASKYSKSSITKSYYSAKITSSTKNRQVYCVVKDKYGKTVTSSKVYLREAASIVTQPKTVTVKKNATAKVTVKASGDGLKYTWYYKNAGAKKYTKVSGSKSYYSVKMTSTTKNRQVYCVVKDKYGKTVQTKTVTLKMK